MQNRLMPGDGLFFYFVVLTVFFLSLEMSFFIQCNQFYLEEFSFVSNKLQLPITILPGIVFFIIVQLTLHFLFCLLTWIVTVLSSDFLKIPNNKRLLFGIGIWLLGLLSIFVANQVFYPNSKFAALTSVILFSPFIARLFLAGLLILDGFLMGIAILVLLKNNNKFRWIFIFGVFFMGFIFLSPFKKTTLTYSAATSEKPNIIIIGIDSLRPDFLNFFGHDTTRTPFIDHWLAKSTVFTEAVTPLARTFPSWTSILTGKYPREINIRTNLADQEKGVFSSSLPFILKKNGYFTLYATDETRFSNISSKFGFDLLVTPPIGLNDFLIGSFNDFPISNLLVNTPIGKWIFPYSYANRPVHFTYNPNSFIKMITPTLQTQRDKPLFLAIHFCLPHTPYLWADLSGKKLTPLKQYEKSIDRVDQQIRDFFAVLENNHLLDHAIVVMLSDHGEALELTGDRITEKSLYLGKKSLPKFYPPSLDDEDWNQSVGHGTDVLGLTQYHTLLGFRLYGFGHQYPKLMPGVVSLIEIKPTILQLIGLNSSSRERSLVPHIRGEKTAPLKPLHIFLESDFSPASIRTVYPDVKTVLLEGIQLFQIDGESTRLTVKDSMQEMIIQSKQYADIYGDWILALYPQQQRVYTPILVNLVTGEWTNDMNSPYAKSSPANKMLAALKTFYGKEIKSVTSLLSPRGPVTG